MSIISSDYEPVLVQDPVEGSGGPVPPPPTKKKFAHKMHTKKVSELANA